MENTVHNGVILTVRRAAHLSLDTRSTSITPYRGEEEEGYWNLIGWYPKQSDIHVSVLGLDLPSPVASQFSSEESQFKFCTFRWKVKCQIQWNCTLSCTLENMSQLYSLTPIKANEMVNISLVALIALDLPVLCNNSMYTMHNSLILISVLVYTTFYTNLMLIIWYFICEYLN